MDPWIFAVSVTFLTSIFGLFIYLRFTSQKVREISPLPPSPPAWPILGHLHLLGTLPHQSLRLLSEKYGPLMYLRLGSARMAVVSSPEMIREFLKLNDAQFASRPQTIVSRYVSYNFQGIALSPNGPIWKQLRKICAVELFSPRPLESFRDIREEELLRMSHSVWGQCQGRGEVNVRSEVWSLMYHNICRMVMGERHAGGSLTHDMFRDRVETAIRLTVGFHLGDYFPSLKWLDFQRLERRIKMVMGDLDATVREIVDEHRRRRELKPDSPPNDIIDVLLAHSEGSEMDANTKLTDTNVKAVMLDLFAGGTDTAAVTTEWALAELLRCPREMERAQEELDKVVGRERRVQEADLSKLPYLEAIIKETLRLHPVAPLLLPHQNEDNCKVAGYFIPAKTRLVVNIWAIGRDPNVWKEPLLFNPQRFLEGGTNIDFKGQDLQFIPFGTGRRICPGMSLGFLMPQMAVASLIHGFNWSLPHQDGTPLDLDMSEIFGSTLPRAKPLIAFPAPRLESSSLYHFHGA